MFSILQVPKQLNQIQSKIICIQVHIVYQYMQKMEKIKRFLVLVFDVLFAAGFESVTRCFWSFNGADEIQFPVLYIYLLKASKQSHFFCKAESIPKFKALVKFCHPSQPCGHLNRKVLIQKSIWNCGNKLSQISLTGNSKTGTAYKSLAATNIKKHSHSRLRYLCTLGFPLMAAILTGLQPGLIISCLAELRPVWRFEAETVLDCWPRWP